jgi:hypothetical protein
MPPILPTRCRIFSFQHNGQFLFVSNDKEGDDRVVEAHPHPNESRNIFEPQELDRFNYRLFHPDTGSFLFVSDDKAGGDNIVEGHPFRDEFRNQFTIRKFEDDVPTPHGNGASFTFFNIQYGLFMFLSNDRRGADYVIEAHGADELRNRFVVLPA